MSKTTLDFDHPWPGLDSFCTQDAPFFRGRETEIQQLLQLVRRARIVVLYGASGLGKTSLVNAGVVPRLGDEYFAVPVRITYGDSAPLVSEQLQDAIFKSRDGRDGMPAPRPGATAWELLHLRDEPIQGPQPFIILDQFEELFTIGAGTPQAAELTEELKALVEGIPPLSVRERLEQTPGESRRFAFQRNEHRVMLSIREDFLFGLESLRAQVPSIIHNRYRIGPLGGGAAMDVVMQPPPPGADTAGRSPLVDAEVAEQIVRTVASTAGDERPVEALEVDPALLSVLCAELARRRSPGTPISRELVRINRSEIISNLYERAMRGVPVAVRAYIEDHLVTPMGFRTSAVLVEAQAVPGFTDKVLADLVNSRLLRVLDHPNGSKRIELTHDTLTEVAVCSRKARQAHKRAEEEEREQVASRKRRRLRQGILVFAVTTALAVAGALRVWHLYNHSREAEDKLRRQYIISVLLEGRDYSEALVSLASVLKTDPDATWASALIGDLLVRRRWPVPETSIFPSGPFTALDCNRSGTRCAAAYRDGNVFVRGDLSLDLKIKERGYGQLAMSPDGKHLLYVPEQPGGGYRWTLDAPGGGVHNFRVEATWNDWWSSSDGRLVVFPSGRYLTFQSLEGAEAPQPITRNLGNAPFFLNDSGDRIAYLDSGNGGVPFITVHNLDDGSARHAPVADTVTSIRIDPKSTTMVAATAEGVLLRWKLSDLTELPPVKAGRPIDYLQFNWTGSQLALRLEDGAVALWDLGWQSPRTLLPSGGGGREIRFSPDEDWVAVSTRNGLVGGWTNTGESLGEPVRHDSLAFARVMNDRMLSASLTGATGRWSLRGASAPLLQDLGQPVRMAWFLSDDSLFAAGNSKAARVTLGGEAQLMELPRGRLSFSRDLQTSSTIYTDSLHVRSGIPKQLRRDDADRLLIRDQVDKAEFSGDGTRLAAVSSGKGYLFDVAAGKPIGDPMDQVENMWLSHDGKTLATKAAETGLLVWGCTDEDGKLKKLADLDATLVDHVAFARDGDALVQVSGKRARVWSLKERRYRNTVMHAASIVDAQFSLDGRWLATAAKDGKARIWDATTGLPASDWLQHPGTVTAVSFSPSGRRLLTASTDGKVRVWDVIGTGESTRAERLELARLAELLSGMRVEPATGEAVAAPYAGEAVGEFHRNFDQRCPDRKPESPECRSAVNQLFRVLLGEPEANATPPPNTNR